MTAEFDPQTSVDSHHPGPPRFVTVGERIPRVTVDPQAGQAVE